MNEREKYEFMWGRYPAYRAKTVAEREILIQFFLSHLKPYDTVNDYGCGTGRPAEKIWRGLHDVTMIDIAENCLDPAIKEMLGDGFKFIQADLREMGPGVPPSDWGFCCDVMEHIPVDDVERVLEGIAQRSPRCFFQIADWRDHTGPKVLGEHLHCTILNNEEWEKRLLHFFSQVGKVHINLGDDYVVGYQAICST